MNNNSTLKERAKELRNMLSADHQILFNGVALGVMGFLPAGAKFGEVSHKQSREAFTAQRLGLANEAEGATVLAEGNQVLNSVLERLAKAESETGTRFTPETLPEAISQTFIVVSEDPLTKSCEFVEKATQFTQFL